MAKKVLKTKRNTVAVTPYVVLSLGAPLGSVVPVDTVPARMAIDAIMPKAPNSIRVRRPVLSISGRATKEAKKYSVPLAAANSRDISELKPREFSNKNVA